MRRERRRFLRLVAAGAAAAVVAASPAPLRAAAEEAAGKPAPARGRVKKDARAEAIEAEVRRQKESLAATLAVLREYPLEPGSEPAFVFAPLPVRRPASRAAPRPRRGGAR